MHQKVTRNNTPIPQYTEHNMNSRPIRNVKVLPEVKNKQSPKPEILRWSTRLNLTHLQR